MCEIPLGTDPDGESDIIATLVRYNPENHEQSSQKETDQHNTKDKTGQTGTTTKPRPAILYTHGMSDYFFQAHVAEKFYAQGFDFYALDLRKCGRSWREGQTFHYVTDLRFYFEELSKALNIITQDHDCVIPMGHSTGGLLLALWLNHLRRENKAQHSAIKGAIFNSPWLDFMAPRPVTQLITPLFGAVGKKFPHLLIPAGGLGVYGQSAHVNEQGYWDFNLDWKPIKGQKKYVGWLRSILLSQRQIQQGRVNCGVPTLTLCSDKTFKGKEFSADAQVADSVLWVEQIQRWAPKLSRNSTVHTIPDVLHDVFLSGEKARTAAFASCFSWLQSIPLPSRNHYRQ